MKKPDALMIQGFAAIVAGIVALASWQLAYRPRVRAYERDHKMTTILSDHVADLELMVAASGGAAAWLVEKQAELIRLKSRVPHQAQLPTLLNELVDLLKGSELKLHDVEQGNLQAVRLTGTKQLLIGDQPCYRLPVKVAAEGRFYALLAALERLSGNEFPTLVGIDGLKLRIRKGAKAILDAKIDLQLYVVGVRSAPGG